MEEKYISEEKIGRRERHVIPLNPFPSHPQKTHAPLAACDCDGYTCNCDHSTDVCVGCDNICAAENVDVDACGIWG